VVGTVTLYFQNEPPFTVPAYGVGALAVHRVVSPVPRWGISHAGTGRLIGALTICRRPWTSPAQPLARSTGRRFGSRSRRTSSSAGRPSWPPLC
jgi:hypothetical protein